MPTVMYNTVLLLGAPGSGKGTWGKGLGMMPGFYHLSTGDIFRGLDPESEMGITVMKIIQEGELVPDEVAFELWKQYMSRAILLGAFRPQQDILILDGLPRTPRQAEMLKPLAEVKAVLLLDCDDRELLVKRLRKRALLEHRADDANEQTIRYRFDVYDAEIESILAYFPAPVIAKIDVSVPPVRILSSISTALAQRL
ncbi:MAG: nucleoside monophosphate kinase [candidate division KSB1 bacterium]|nr:nucleoside monophosphate kinase [candidate division KSB1 bacterium]